MSGEILSADELEPARQFVGFVKRNGGTQGAQRNSAADLIERLLDSHEALRARLAEVEAERDKYRTEAHILTRERDEAHDARVAAEARLAEVEAERDALREAVEGRWDACDQDGEPILPRGWTLIDGGRYDELEDAERRLAEVEQALHDLVGAVLAAAEDRRRRPTAAAFARSSTPFARARGMVDRAVLDKGEQG